MSRQDNKGRAAILTVEETAYFCSQAAMILKSGLPLEENLKSLCEEASGQNGFAPLKDLAAALENTSGLVEALEEAPVLPEYAIRMIGIGAMSGTLDDVLSGLGDYYFRSQQIQDRVKSAIAYPAALTLLMGSVIAVLLFRVLPVFARVLDSMGAGGTRTGEAVTRLGVVLGGISMCVTLLILGAIAAAAWSLKGGPGADRVNQWMLKLPPVRRILRTLAAERFTAVMAMLVKSGYPMEEALSQTADLPVDVESRAKILKARDAFIQEGSLANAVGSAGILDNLHVRMLETACAAGMMDASLEKLSDIYAERLDRDIRTGEALIEPALVALLAIVAGAVLLSLMMPLANMLTGML